jgi:hypothetical protein
MLENATTRPSEQSPSDGTRGREISEQARRGQASKIPRQPRVVVACCRSDELRGKGGGVRTGLQTGRAGGKDTGASTGLGRAITIALAPVARGADELGETGEELDVEGWVSLGSQRC